MIKRFLSQDSSERDLCFSLAIISIMAILAIVWLSYLPDKQVQTPWTSKTRIEGGWLYSKNGCCCFVQDIAAVKTQSETPK